MRDSSVYVYQLHTSITAVAQELDENRIHFLYMHASFVEGLYFRSRCLREKPLLSFD